MAQTPTMRNPWQDLPESAPFVLPDDAPVVEAWNKYASEREQLRLDLVPQPWLGRWDAPVVVLNLNPGIGSTDVDDQLRPDVMEAARRNLMHEPQRYPHFFLDPQMAETGGGRWWARRCLASLVRATGDAKLVAERVLGLEFYGYHSKSFSGLPVTMPSQHYVFSGLQAAIERNAIVLVMRGIRFWAAAVPDLADHARCFVTKNPQTASVSAGNLEPDHYEQILQALDEGGISSSAGAERIRARPATS